ncbi:MAG: hypothetical protein RLZZ546_2930, partial [Bacteroidota bacterium]
DADYDLCYKILIGSSYYTHIGAKQYEFANHLGNIMTTFTDRKLGMTDKTGYIYYIPHLLTAQQYYAFGSMMPGYNFSAGDGYRYGFNGKEKDDEVKGSGNSLDFGARIYDSRLGRFLSVDPLANTYPWNSPFAFAENRVLDGIDVNGEGWDDFKSYIEAKATGAAQLIKQKASEVKQRIYQATKEYLSKSTGGNVSRVSGEVFINAKVEGSLGPFTGSVTTELAVGESEDSDVVKVGNRTYNGAPRIKFEGKSSTVKKDWKKWKLGAQAKAQLGTTIDDDPTIKREEPEFKTKVTAKYSKNVKVAGTGFTAASEVDIANKSTKHYVEISGGFTTSPTETEINIETKKTVEIKKNATGAAKITD